MNDNNPTHTNARQLSSEQVTSLRESFEHVALIDEQKLSGYLGLPKQQREAFATYVLYESATVIPLQARFEAFETDYFGSYSTWGEARDALMGFFGWDKALADADVRDGNDWSLTELLTWDEEAVRKRLEEELNIVELDTGAIVIFHR